MHNFRVSEILYDFTHTDRRRRWTTSSASGFCWSKMLRILTRELAVRVCWWTTNGQSSSCSRDCKYSRRFEEDTPNSWVTCVINQSACADKTHPSFDGVIRQFRLASLPWARENCESFKRVDVAPLTSVGGAFSHGDMFIILPTTRAVNCLFSSSFWWVGWVRMNNALLRPSVFSIFLCSYTEVESR